jgi:hypothetical protein
MVAGLLLLLLQQQQAVVVNDGRYVSLKQRPGFDNTHSTTPNDWFGWRRLLRCVKKAGRIRNLGKIGQEHNDAFSRHQAAAAT